MKEIGKELLKKRFLQSVYKLGPLKYLPEEVFNAIGGGSRVRGNPIGIRVGRG
ncbi:MAG: hypothetical protein ACLPXM_08090 [Terriglobales bacterium]